MTAVDRGILESRPSGAVGCLTAAMHRVCSVALCHCLQGD